jgi:hypothetical protein
MLRSSCKPVFALPLLSFVSLALTGCTMGSFPTVPATEQAQVVSPPLQGSVFGGHAPLVGALVYVLTPNQSANYGLSNSLMDGDTQNASLTPSGTGNSAVSSGGSNGYHYATTDVTGAFNLTGDYACTVNQAVYLVAVGGSPTFPSTSNNFATSQVVTDITAGVPGLGATATYTFTTTTTENFYVGEQIVLSGYTGNLAVLNGTQTVLSTNLTTNTFAVIAGTYLLEINSTQAVAAAAQAEPTFNPAVINMAALGLCPASGSFAGTVNFVYMNEVSTAALAVAMGAFGNDAFHIGVATGGPVDAYYPSYDKNGMKQAMNNAGLLYDIQGSNTSTTYAGEGHIARSVTPSGNGIVPQTMMDTWGNILAACVDSQNTTTAPSAQCNTLFATATSTGVACPVTGGKVACPTGTGQPVAPADTATAAFNIAHFPAGTGNTAFMNTLYTLPTGNVPFTPDLTYQPNDFTVALAFTAPSSAGGTNNLINQPQVIAIDGGNYVGNEYGGSGLQEGVWIGNFGGQAVKLFANFGTPDYATNASTTMAGTANVRSVAIDANENVWMTQQTARNLLEVSNTGTLVNTISPPTGQANAFTTGPLNIAIDSAGTTYNVYVPDYTSNLMDKFTSAGANVVATGGAVNSAFATTASAPCLSNSESVILDPAGHVYIDNVGNGDACAINPTTGTQLYAAAAYTTGTITGYSYGPPNLAIDRTNVVWGPNANTNALVGYTYGSATLKTYTGGGLNVPCSTAVDGANNIWVGNGATWSVSEFTNAGVALSPAANTASSTYAVGGYNPQGKFTLTLNGLTVFNPAGGVTDCANPAIDRAGDVWMAYQGTGAGAGVIFEILGVAAPVVTPTSYATFGNGSTGFLGQRPY